MLTSWIISSPVWNLSTATPLSNKIWCLFRLDDDNLLVGFPNGTIETFNISLKRSSHYITIDNNPVLQIYVFKRYDYWIALSESAILYIINFHSKTIINAIKLHSTSNFIFSELPNNILLISQGTNQLEYWSVEWNENYKTWKLINTYEITELWVWNDGRWLTISDWTLVYIWYDATNICNVNKDVITIINTQNTIRHARQWNDQRLILSGFYCTLIYDVNNFQVQLSISDRETHVLYLQEIINCKLLLVSRDDKIKIWDLKSNDITEVDEVKKIMAKSSGIVSSKMNLFFIKRKSDNYIYNIDLKAYLN